MRRSRAVGNPPIGSSRETVKTVPLTFGRSTTPLKRGVNESGVCAKADFKSFSFFAAFAVLVAVFCLGAARGHAAESSGIRVEAILVWAAHSAKTNDTNLKELEP